MRCSLPQSQMRAVLVIVVNVFGKQPLQMAFVHRDDVIQQVTLATRDPSLRHPVLPRTFGGGADRSDFERSRCCRNLNSIFAITIKDEKSRSRFPWKCFPQLLDDPQAHWVLRDVEIQDPPTIVANDEEAVEHAERNRRDGEEIHRSDGFSMVTKKGEPTFRRFRISWRFAHPSGNGSFRNIETEHEKLPMNARCTPARVLGHHTEDEIPCLFGNPLPTRHSPIPGDHTPIERASRSVPSHDGLRPHEGQGLFPSGPEP